MIESGGVKTLMQHEIKEILDVFFNSHLKITV